MKIRVVDSAGLAKEPGEYVVKAVSSTDTEIVFEVVDTLHRGTTITELEEIVDSVVCGYCGDVTDDAEPFCNGPICFKRGD